jgi:uncharacterized protein (DUF305 family)
VVRTLVFGVLAALAAACARHAPPPGSAEDPGVVRARADSAQYPYTAADIRFMSGMIAHHAQAIRMARWAPTHGAGPAVVRLSERIVNAQTDEITLMQQWLRDRRQPVPAADARPPVTEHAGMQHGGMTHETLMPGMLTDEQLVRLDAARGQEFDRLFLTYMIQHHRGAVAMVKALFESHGAGQDVTVFKFASDVSVDQTTEINRMLQMLLTLGAAPRSP